MFYPDRDQEIEATLQRHERRCKEIASDIASMEEASAELFRDLDLRPEQLDAFLSNPDYLHPKDWERVQNDRRAFQTRCEALAQGPSKTKKSAPVGAHWLFCR